MTVTPKMITKKQAKRLLKLLERRYHCEIMACYGEWGQSLGYIDYALKQVEYEKRILKLLYGTTNLVELGVKWKILNTRKRKKIKKKNSSKSDG